MECSNACGSSLWLHQEVAARREARKEAKRAAKRQRTSLNDDEGQGGEREDTEDPYDELFDAAQQQLQQEMASAGMDGMLPMSFGGSRAVGRPRSKKRKRVDNDIVYNTAEEDGADPDGHAAVKETKLVEKVHVTYDSDGEVAARKVENVEVEVKAPKESVAAAAITQEKAAAALSTPKQIHTPPGTVAVMDIRECVVVLGLTVACLPVTRCFQVAKDVRKFWAKRNILFYKYNDGIQLDHESWYSVTPQAIAEHIAARCRCDVVVDPFAGCGGNVIQLAKTCRAVIAIDIDPEKIRMAKHNAAIYGVAHKIEFIVGDSMAILPTLKGADVVFLSPPWGGVKYNRKRFDLDEMVVKGVSGSELFAMARKVTKNVAYYLPKTTPASDLEALAPDEAVECEMVVLNKKTSVMTAYYGDLVKTSNGE